MSTRVSSQITMRPGIETTEMYKNAVESSRIASDNAETFARNLWNMGYNGRGKPAIKDYMDLSDEMQKMAVRLNDLHMKLLQKELP